MTKQPTNQDHDGLATRAAGSLVWAGGSTLIRLGVEITLIAALARLLTPEDYGVVAASLIALSLARAAAKEAFLQPLVQAEELAPRKLGAGIFLTVVSGLALFGALYSAAAPVASLLDIPDVRSALEVMAAAIPLYAAGAVPEARLQRSLRFRPLAIIDLSSTIFGYAAVSLSLAWLGYGFWALVWAHVAQAALRTVVLVVFAGYGRPARAGREDVRALSITAFAVIGAKLSDVASQQVDNVIVAKALGPASLGVYNRAFRMAREPANIMQGAVGAVLFSGLSRASHHPAQRRAGYRRALSLTVTLYMPLSALGLVLADELVFVVLGPDWSDAAQPLAILMLSLYLRAGYMVHATALRATGYFYSNAAMALMYAGLVAIGAAAGARYGLSGVCVGIVLAGVVRYLLMGWLSARLTGTAISLLARAHGLGFALFALTLAVAYATQAPLREAGAHPVVVLALAGSAACLAVAAAAVLMWNKPAFADVRWLWERTLAALGR